MTIHDLARRQWRTAKAFIDAKHGGKADVDTWIEKNMALRSPDCIHAVRPKLANLPDMNNDQYRKWLRELHTAQIITCKKVCVKGPCAYYTAEVPKMTIKSVTSGDDNSIVIVRVAYDLPTWPSGQQMELEFALTLTEAGDKIKRDEVRLVDSGECEQWREASNAYLERIQLQATQDWLKEQNAKWL